MFGFPRGWECRLESLQHSGAVRPSFRIAQGGLGVVCVSYGSHDGGVAYPRNKWHHTSMSIETMEREIVELKQRLASIEAKVQPVSSQRWRAAVGSVKPNELTREAARLGAEWRAEENERR